jgi:hypothetical protein
MVCEVVAGWKGKAKKLKLSAGEVAMAEHLFLMA